MGEGRRAVGGGEGQELLTRVDLGAMLLGEGAGRRHAFDVGEQEAGEGERDDAVDVPQTQTGKGQIGQAGGQDTHRLEAELGERGDGQRDDRGDHHPEGDGTGGQELVADHEQDDGRDAEGEDGRLGVG